MVDKINIAAKFAQINDHWNPRVAAELNGQAVKMVKFQGEFVWHHHDHEDEMFLVIDGEFDMQFRDHTVTLKAGEFIVIPRGVEHRPVAENEVQVILFEPTETLNTGNVKNKLTVEKTDKI